MEFEWDEAKAASNLEKHGVAFEDAAAIFGDPRQLTERARQVAGEQRLQTISGRCACSSVRRAYVSDHRRSVADQDHIRPSGIQA